MKRAQLAALAAALVAFAILPHFLKSYGIYLMTLFCVRYRAGNAIDRGGQTEKSWHWEVSWTTASLVAFLGLFCAAAFFELHVWAWRDNPQGAFVDYNKKVSCEGE